MQVRSCFHKGKGPTIAIEKWTLRPLVGWSYINDNDRIYQASCNWPFQTCEKGTCRAWLQSAKPNVCKVKPIDRRPCQQFDEVIIWSSSLWTGFLLFIHAGASQVALDLSAVTSYECLLYTHVLIWLHICCNQEDSSVLSFLGLKHCINWMTPAWTLFPIKLSILCLCYDT